MHAMRSWFSRLSQSRRNSFRRREVHRLQELEARCLLAGNIAITDDGAALRISGDSDANELEIISVPTGIVARGLNGTTINGVDEVFPLSNTATVDRSVRILLRAGDDQLTIHDSVSFARDALILGGAGADWIAAAGISTAGDLTIAGGAGENTILLNGVTAAQQVNLRSEGAALLGIQNSTIAGPLVVATNEGNDQISISNTSVSRIASISTAAGDDTLLIEESQLSRLIYKAGRGKDLVQISETEVTRRTALWMLNGDDATVIGEGNNFPGRLILGGLLGNDQREIASSTVTGRVRQYGSPAEQVDPALVGERLDSEATGLRPALESAFSKLKPDLSATLSSSTITEGEAPELTVVRAGSTSSPLTVTLAVTDDSRRSELPATIEIPAGQSAAVLSISVTNDHLFQENHDLTIAVSAGGYDSSEAVLTVQNDDSRSLSLTSAAATIAENNSDGLTLTVARNDEDLSAAVTVSLSADSNSVTIPATVEIPAGQSSTEVTLVPVDNQTADSDRTVQVLAEAADYVSSSVDIVVSNDESAAVFISPSTFRLIELVPTPQVFTVSRNTADTSADLTVSLAANSDRITIPASVVIPAGSDSIQFTVTANNNDLNDGNILITLTATAAGLADGTAEIDFIDDDYELTLIPDAATTLQTSGVVLTKQSDLVLTGTTAPNALVMTNLDGDGLFDDVSTTADADGNFTITIPLTHTSQNNGQNFIAMMSGFGATNSASLTAHYATGTVMQFQTALGNIDVEMLDADTPNTLANFLSYQQSGAWDNLIVHRSQSNFVIQAGGYTVENGLVERVGTSPPINSEANAANSNVRGTLAMALLGGDVNSGTSQWYFNVADNTFLDAEGFTVFGRVIGTGMDVVDSINDLTIYSLFDMYQNSALGTVPLQQAPPAGDALTGTLETLSGSVTVIGTDTAFLSELAVDQIIKINGSYYQIQQIVSDTELQITTTPLTGNSGLTGYRNVTPNDSDFVIFDVIEELLAD